MLERILDIARADPRIRALLLSGSRGSGTEDAVSDWDLIAIAAPEEHVDIARRWIAAFDDAVFHQSFERGTVLVNLVLRDWSRIDLLLRPTGHVAGLDPARMRVLLDQDGHCTDLASQPAPPPASAGFIEAQVNEFLRVLGLLHVCAARNDWVLGLSGCGLLHGRFVTLLRAEDPAPQPGGILHLKADLPEDSYAALAALPVPDATREGIVRAHAAIAAATLPRARRLLEARGGTWPQAFEDATLTMLETRVAGFTCPRT